MIVTIDGPAAAGKSTVARALAQRLGFSFLDTGAMYRAVTLAALRRRVPFDDERELEKLVASLTITLDDHAVWLDGEDVSIAIRDVAVTRATHQIADSPAVRRRMVVLQREAARGRDLVTEGRDQGSIVFPDAACKFFLIAQAEVRAKRRLIELEQRGHHISLEQVLADQAERDHRDAARAIAPMAPTPDSIVLDTSDLPLEQVVTTLEQHVRARSALTSDL